MKNPIKKVAAIHDLAGYGRTSLTAIIPVLSSMGIQVCPFPTAILSNNTSCFDEFSFVDLTNSMEDYTEYWERGECIFDCIYSGFLGSEKQIDIILSFIDIFKSDSNIVVVDPVLGDHGKLYPTIDENMVGKMRSLVEKSDIITPNFTEAMYLLDKKHTKKIKENEMKDILVELSDLGPEIVVVTSVPNYLLSESIDVFGYDKGNDEFWRLRHEHIPVEFPGTGDIFTSVLIGSLLNGDRLPIALDRSVEFVFSGIKESCKYLYPKREGILLEKILGNLKKPLEKTNCKLIFHSEEQMLIEI